MSCIFISYRRDDSAYAAHQLRDRLASHFGIDNIIFDVESIPLGTDFRNYITEQITKCDVLLAVMGNEWLKTINARSDDPKDFVRIEIEAALKRDIPVIPVLVEKAVMPDDSALPESIADLAYRNATEVRAGADFHSQLDRLVASLENLLGTSKPDKTKPQQITSVENTTPEVTGGGGDGDKNILKSILFGIFLIAILGGSAYWFFTPHGNTSTQQSSGETSGVTASSDEKARLAEEQRRAEEARRAEEQHKTEEAARRDEEKRRAEEAARRDEEKRRAEEAARRDEEKRRAEEARRAEEQRNTATAKESQCFDMVQGRVAWNKSGNQSWNPDNIKKLCRGTTNPNALIACFKMGIKMHGDWNRAAQECKPDTKAVAVIEAQCFNMVQGKVAWNKSGNRSWNPDNIKKLCRGTTNPRARIACFIKGIKKHGDWARAANECKATP